MVLSYEWSYSLPSRACILIESRTLTAMAIIGQWETFSEAFVSLNVRNKVTEQSGSEIYH